MMEMTQDVVSKYFDFIHKHIDDNGYFLNINRYIKMTRLHEYPYDSNWEVILSQKAYKQKHIHFLLTQREYKEWDNNIVDEMKLIYKESLNFGH